MSQEKTSQFIKLADRDGFGIRLREAFEGAIDAEIARKLGVSQAAVKNYIEGRIPGPEKLAQISGLTNCSIHWTIPWLLLLRGWYRPCGFLGLFLF